MAKRMPEAVYEDVFARAESDAFFVACEVNERSVCTFVATEWHHRKMRSQGGAHQVANGLAVCKSCHMYFHAHPAIAYSNGWLVRSHLDPASVPVKRRDRLVRLFDDGSFEEVNDAA